MPLQSAAIIETFQVVLLAAALLCWLGGLFAPRRWKGRLYVAALILVGIATAGAAYASLLLER